MYLASDSFDSFLISGEKTILDDLVGNPRIVMSIILICQLLNELLQVLGIWHY